MGGLPSYGPWNILSNRLMQLPLSLVFIPMHGLHTQYTVVKADWNNFFPRNFPTHFSDAP
jgi:hypothetical protein